MRGRNQPYYNLELRDVGVIKIFGTLSYSRLGTESCSTASDLQVEGFARQGIIESSTASALVWLDMKPRLKNPEKLPAQNAACLKTWTGWKSESPPVSPVE